ncbi:MAG: TonB-dependent siderophore receptor [Hydrococcus sp. Prado102]|nr:TonB-dependent siderophore receptor [Hydrococcus sp. Prado102]
MKLGHIARLFWLAGAIGVLDINPVLSQEVRIAPMLREERASQISNNEKKFLELTCCAADLSIISHSFEDESSIFNFPPPLQRHRGIGERRRLQIPPTQPPTNSIPLARQGGQIISVTGVQLNPTETGIELILQTPTGVAELLQPNNISSGNNFIVEIPNAQLQLPDSKPFRQEKPIEGISEVTVTNQDANTIRVTVTGETALPQVELFDSDEGLIFGFTPPPALQGGTQGTGETPPARQSKPEEIITITGVQLNPTETGIELILQTPTGVAELLQPNNISSGNNFIVEIPNAQLQLPSSKPFRQEKPIEGISSITVTNLDASTIRVNATGENALPQVELFDSDTGLIFGLTPVTSSAQTPPNQQSKPEEIITITGVQLNPTETGIELILQTPTGVAEILQPNNISSGNNFIVEIPNAQLQLPSSKPFGQANPTEGISSITVTNLDASTVRVNATGETALPQVELFDSEEGLIFGFTPVEDSAQTPTPQMEEGQIVSIDRVQLNQTETGFEIILLTPTDIAQQLRVVNISEGNNFIAEIPNAQLRLPDGQPFRAENPIEGVSEVTVTNQNENTIRVTAAGEEKQPTVELFDSEDGLIFSAVGDAPSAQGEEDIELVVTGEQDGYFVPNSSVGTRTDTPLRDIPQSIQVIPQQVLEDQNITNFQDALRNVAGVTPTVDFGDPIVRGFNTTVLRDGLSEASAFGYGTDFQSNIEQIEILRGPASVLYGSGEPGGVINLTEKQPLSEPFYKVGATIGNYDSYRGTLDFTGPLNRERTILYRLNTSYENSGSFIDFVDREEFAIFPVLSFQLGDNSRLTFDGGYRRASNPSDLVTFYGLPLEGTLLPNPLGEIPRSRFLGEPDFDEADQTNWNIGYLLEFEFSEDWSIRNRFRYNYASIDSRAISFDSGLLEEDNRTFNRVATSNQVTAETYTLRTDLLGQFQTGIIEHDILFGLELRRATDDGINRNGTEIFPIDVFDPQYGNFRTDTEITTSSFTTGDNIGIYAQDLLSIGEKVKLLLGGRFDIVFSRTEDRLFPEFSVTQDTITNFAPRVGIVYQPIEPVSLYASWSRSFDPEFGTDREGNPFVPIEGEQFEVGVKTEFLNGRLAATLSAYQITRQNDLQPDPVDPNFSIQIGEQRSRGIDFDLRGEPLPGLRLIANYSYIDAVITEDTTGVEGNQVRNVPRHSGSIWAVYEIQEGNLQGLGLGAGVFVVGDRQGNSGNTFKLPSYALTNALLYYRRDNWRVQLNFENLFDTDYFINSYTDNSAIPGRPFTVRGQVFVQF